jgi:hypothetical protein
MYENQAQRGTIYRGAQKQVMINRGRKRVVVDTETEYKEGIANAGGTYVYRTNVGENECRARGPIGCQVSGPSLCV